MTQLTFLGTGTSQGVPVVACGCWVCSSKDGRDHRLRSSVMIERNGVRIIIDAGPDFRQQMLRENIKHVDAIVTTHEHKDHIGGIDDLRAFNGSSQGSIDIYATNRVQEVIRKDYDYAFGRNRYPGVPNLNLITIDGNKPFEVKGEVIIPIEGLHHKLPVLGFRVGGIAYLTDFNHIADDQIEKVKGVEILIVNALRHEHHLSHFTLEQALHVSCLIQPKQTYLTHISHQMGRYAPQSKLLPKNSYFAYDGLVVESQR